MVHPPSFFPRLFYPGLRYGTLDSPLQLLKATRVFFICENILDREYAASNFGGISLRALPRQVFGGLRLKLG
jgi:hypothetical protein